jgi:hypothetical protein
MSLTGNLETNALGGGGFGSGFGGAGFGFGGGFGGIAPVGLVGLNTLFDRDRGHGDNNGALWTVNAIGNLKDSIYNAKDSLDERIDSVKDNLDDRLDSIKDALTSRVENVGDRVTAEGRNISDRVADANVSNLNQFYAQAIQAERNTQQLSTQAQALAIANNQVLTEIKEAGVAQTAAILARLNQAEVDRLRDELEVSRRHADRRDTELSIVNTNTNTNSLFQAQAQAQLQAQFDDYKRRFDSREIEINNINTNSNVQSQLQAQAQAQLVRDFEHNRRFDALYAQTAKATNDIVNIGGLVAATQANTPTNNSVGK